MDTSKKPRTTQAGDKYLIRFPEGMRERLADAAKANNRSTNAEIVARLERTLAQDASAPAGTIDDAAPEVMAEIERRAKEWGCSKTQALIRITLEEVSAGKGDPKGR